MVAIPCLDHQLNYLAQSKVQKTKPPKKARNKKINQDYLNHRAKYLQSIGHEKSKWIIFCEEMLRVGLDCELYEAQRTKSKYVTVKMPDDWSRSYKVRFSDHKPIRYRETARDCNFFVGVTNFHVTTTQQAITATLQFFGVNRW